MWRSQTDEPARFSSDITHGCGSCLLGFLRLLALSEIATYELGVKGEPPAQRQDRDASTTWALQGDANLFAALVRLIGHRLSEVVFIPLTTPNGRLGSWLIFYCCIVLNNVDW